MPADRRYLIRPPEKSWRGGKYVCFRFNGGDWIPDDGEPDLAFVVNDSGWPYAYGAEWPRYFMRHTHQNNLAQEQSQATSREAERRKRWVLGRLGRSSGVTRR